MALVYFCLRFKIGFRSCVHACAERFCGFSVGISPPEFDKMTLAVIRGRLVRYLMRSKEVVFIY